MRSEDETRASLGVTVDGIKMMGATLQNMMGKVFDISHTTYYPEASYDVYRTQTTSVPSAKTVTPQPAPGECPLNSAHERAAHQYDWVELRLIDQATR